MTAVYVYAEHSMLAGCVVAWDPKVKSEEELVEEKGDDIYEYASSEEDAIDRARKVRAAKKTWASYYDRLTAGDVLEYLGAEEHEAPCCECGDRVTWDDEAERTGAGPWDESNAIWCQACWERVGMNQPEKETK